MGCSFSGLNAFYDAVNGGGDVWINENRFRIVRQIGEGGFTFLTDASSAASGGGLAKKVKDPAHLSADGTYAMKKVLIQNKEQLELVREEIRVSSLFSHPNLLPLLDHAISRIMPVRSLVFSPVDPRVLFSGSDDGHVNMHDAVIGKIT